MHVRDERVYQFCDRWYPHILNADVYIGEMDLNPPIPFHQSPIYHAQHHFSSLAYAKMRRQLHKSFGMDLDRYAHLHPLMILSVISQNLMANDHAVSLDEHLWNYAKIHNKEVRGLESVEEQMKLLHAIPAGPLYRQIFSISRNPSRIRRFTWKTLDLYTRGDIHALYQMTKRSMHNLRKPVIYDRNQLMADRILSLDTGLSYFISVGVGHFSGKKGLLSLVRKGGWTIKPV
jgi:uncharacterized protein YbaP (TraB family)